ncbi:MAG: mechanosensitive ion channel protein MscS, partial [Methylophilus sp.]
MFAISTRSALVMAVVAMILIPLAASWFAYPSTHLPPGFGVFPPQFVEEPPGFNLIVFIGVALLEAAFAVFLIFPQWFGFKPVAPS